MPARCWRRSRKSNNKPSPRTSGSLAAPYLAAIAKVAAVRGVVCAIQRSQSNWEGTPPWPEEQETGEGGAPAHH